MANTVNGLSGLGSIGAAAAAAKIAAESDTGSENTSFADMFNQALSSVSGSDYEDKLTNIGLMAGELTDLHTATIAAEKADIMLNLTLQVRNKMVEAYQEIMRMQV